LISSSFFWLPKVANRDYVDAAEMPTVNPLGDCGPGRTALLALNTFEPILSEETYRLSGSCIHNTPWLPSYDLLELQWYLQRVAALSGSTPPIVDCEKAPEIVRVYDSEMED